MCKLYEFFKPYSKVNIRYDFIFTGIYQLNVSGIEIHHRGSTNSFYDCCISRVYSGNYSYEFSGPGSVYRFCTFDDLLSDLSREFRLENALTLDEVMIRDIIE